MLVIGGSAGAGLGVALVAAARDAKEIILVARGEERLAQAKALIAVPCRTIACDVDTQFHLLTAALADTPPDIVVYSAASGGFQCFDELDEAAFDAAMRSTAYGAFRAAQAFLPALLASGRGAFVIIGSPVVRIDFPAIAYKASRGALVGVYEALVEDLRETPVVVCFAEPARISNSGYFDTNAGVAPRLPWSSRLPWTRGTWQSAEEVGQMVCRAIERGQRSAMPLSLRALVTLLPRAVVTWTQRWFSVSPADGGFPERAPRR